MRSKSIHVVACCAVLVAVSACSSPQSSDSQGTETSSAATSNATALVYPEVELYPSNVPREVGDWLSEEIQSFDHPFPSDQYVPHSIVDVFPEIDNALQVEQGEDLEPGKETIMVEIPEPSGTDFPAYVAIARGDAYSAMSNRWYCAWVDEYLSAGEASDSTRTAQALEFLETSQTDEATQGPALNFAVDHEDIYNTLIEGDMEPAKTFVNACETMK